MQTKSASTSGSSENWKPIRGLEKYFEVSDKGNVKSLKRTFRSGSHMLEKTKEDRILQQRISRGYKYAMIEISDGEFRFRRNIPVHRIVAQEFCDNRLGRKEVNHKDGDKMNNQASNLEWMSRSENQKHAFAMGLHKRPKGRRKFSDETIGKVFQLRKENKMHKEIAEELGMGISTVTHILLGTRRNDVTVVE